MNAMQTQPAPRTYVNSNGHTIVEEPDGSWDNLNTGECYDASTGIMTDRFGVDTDTRE